MKRLIGLILLAGLIYGGYVFYNQSKSAKSPQIVSSTVSSKQLSISQVSDKLDAYTSVLGANVEAAIQNGQEYLSDVTNGKSEPIINELVSKTTETLKDLPRKEAEKIKYEFCKGIVTDYEATN